VVGSLTGGSLATHVRVGVIAGVTALQLHTCLVRGTVIMPGTFCVAASEGVSKEVWRTCALGTVVDSLAVCVLSTCSTSASILTAVLLAVTGL